MSQIVRVKTSSWWDGRKLVVKKEITPMKRLSDHCNFLNNDIDNIGAFAVVHNIENLNEVMDGLYSVVMCNVRKDWESGYIADYDYKLVPYQE